MPLLNFQKQEMTPTQIPLNPNENNYIDGIISLWYYHNFIIIMLNLVSVISDTCWSSYFTHIKIRFSDKICNLHVDIIIIHVDIMFLHVGGRTMPPYERIQWIGNVLTQGEQALVNSLSFNDFTCVSKCKNKSYFDLNIYIKYILHQYQQKIKYTFIQFDQI